MPDTYLFTAHYEDGEKYEQPFYDRSVQNPEKNAYYDVHYAPLKPVDQMHAFSLKARDGAAIPPDAPREVAVSLRTGEFAVDNTAFFLHSELIDGPLTNIRLMYYRNPAPMISNNYKEKESTPVGYELGYVLGFEASNAKGKEVKKFIMIRGSYQEAP